ncbi:MAG TPA: hypothetical protein PLA50_11100, partial [Bacteroidia bacterium]|nr:hypothetical protein [Bacteroidia bacterium]
RLSSFVQIGHGGVHGAAPAVGGLFQMPGGTEINTIRPDSSATGDITVIAGGTFIDPEDPGSRVGIKVEAANGSRSPGMIGHGGRNMYALRDTTVSVDFGAGANMGGFNQVQTLKASVGFQGNIWVEAPFGDIVFTGGEAFRAERSWGYGVNFVHLGHGGDGVQGPKGGKITVLAGQGRDLDGDGVIDEEATDGDILFMAGRMYQEHAMLGHGGYDSDSSKIAGWISINDMIASGEFATYSPELQALYRSQGGRVVDGDNTAEIVVKAFGSISFISPPSGPKNALFLSPDWSNWWFQNSLTTPTAGNTGNLGWETRDRFVQLGHGGYASTTIIPDRQDITVISGTGDMENADGDESTGGILFVAGDMERDYAQLGHGGHSASANNDLGFIGDITVTANGGGVKFDASIFGANAVQRRTDVSLNGVNFDVPEHPNATDPVIIGVGRGMEAYAQLGHGGYGARGVHGGNITVKAWGGIEFLAAEAAPPVDHTVTTAPINQAFTAGTNVWVALANLVDTVATGSQKYKMPEGTTGSILPGSVRIVLSDGRVIVDLPNNSSDERQSKLVFEGTTTAIGDIHYELGLVRFTAPSDGTGLTTQAVAEFQTSQGYKERSYVQLGHGGYDADGPNNKASNLPGNWGDIDIQAGGDITFQAGAYHRNYAQLGHGGLDNKGAHSGDITISHVDANHLVGGLWFTAGHGSYRHYDYQSYVQLGHGGYEGDGNHYGNITVLGTEDEDGIGLLLKAGDRENNYAQIGHGGYAARTGSATGEIFYGLNGNIDIEVSGDIAVVAGTMQASNHPDYKPDGVISVMIGHGGQDADAYSNDTNYRDRPAGANATLENAGTAGAGDGNWGHFGDIRVVSTGGNISLMAGNTEALASRTDIYGGTPLAGVDDPLGLLVSWGDGWGRRQSAQIGHGGILAGGNHFGNITVSAGGGVNIAGGQYTVTANTTTNFSYAQIGHNTGEAPGNAGHDGETIKVYALGGDLNMLAGEHGVTHAQIGNGGRNSLGDFKGDIKVIVQGDLRMASAQYKGTSAVSEQDNTAKIGHGDVNDRQVAGTRNGDIEISVGDSAYLG